MNKKQITEALRAKGVEVDTSMPIEGLRQLAIMNNIMPGDGIGESTNTSSNLITVRVTGQAVAENDAHFTKGETFETTPERAAALGSLVEIVEGPAA